MRDLPSKNDAVRQRPCPAAVTLPGCGYAEGTSGDGTAAGALPETRRGNRYGALGTAWQSVHQKL